MLKRLFQGAVLRLFSHFWLFANPWTVAFHAPWFMGFSRQEYCGLPSPPLGDLPNPGIKPLSLASAIWAGRFFTTSTTGKLFSQVKIVIEPWTTHHWRSGTILGRPWMLEVDFTNLGTDKSLLDDSERCQFWVVSREIKGFNSRFKLWWGSLAETKLCFLKLFFVALPPLPQVSSLGPLKRWITLN